MSFCFSTFEIRSQHTQKCVDYNELDKLICEKFDLKYSNEDYGHFPFLEGEMHQESISWAGLIHEIVYWSDIDYGTRRKSEVLGALVYVIKYAIRFPMRMIDVLSKLLDFIYDEQKMYIYVSVHPDKYDPSYLYKNIYAHKMILKNETGLFECDEDGKLLSYYPSIEVLMEKNEVRERYTYRDSYYRPCIHSMMVPEGITSFSHDFFRGGYIAETLKLPSTIKTIGSEKDICVFADTSIGRIILPDSIESIGTFAFGNSEIEEFVYPNKIIEFQYLRQFKGTRINRLLLPQNVSCYLQTQDRCIESLFNPCDTKIMNCIVF
jgi:hypothetical protein